MNVQNTPCRYCPYRRDVPSGICDASEYEKLCEYDRPTMEQPFAPFACHREPESFCTGWLVVGLNRPHDRELIALRLASAFGSLDLSSLDCDANQFFKSGTEACVHGMEDIDCPGEDASVAAEYLGRVIGQRGTQ